MGKEEAAVFSIGFTALACSFCFLVFRVSGCEVVRMQTQAVEAEAQAAAEAAKTERVKTYADMGDKLILIEAEKP